MDCLELFEKIGYHEVHENKRNAGCATRKQKQLSKKFTVNAEFPT